MPIGILPDHPGTTPGTDDPTTEDKSLHPPSGTKDPDRRKRHRGLLEAGKGHPLLIVKWTDPDHPEGRFSKSTTPIDTDKISKLESMFGTTEDAFRSKNQPPSPKHEGFILRNHF